MNITASVDIDDRHRLYVKSDECDYKMLVAENVKAYTLKTYENKLKPYRIYFVLEIELFNKSICFANGVCAYGDIWLSDVGSIPS